MPTHTYGRPPIVEALLDVQVELAPTFPVESLAKCQQTVKGEYPQRALAQQITGQVTVGKSLSTSATAEAEGYVFASPDKTQLFQAKKTGFTFNRLAPYPGWGPFFAEALRLWEVYRKVARPTAYKRAALRYINRFDIPGQEVKMEAYFRTYPEISRDLPQVMVRFFSQVSLPIEDAQATATITQTAVEPALPGHSSIILDIDVFRAGELRGNELQNLFETLRIWKNKIFEACLTDASRELIR
jgi:uncharacterized protein (TIGR04255 family)